MSNYEVHVISQQTKCEDYTYSIICNEINYGISSIVECKKIIEENHYGANAECIIRGYLDYFQKNVRLTDVKKGITYIGEKEVFEFLDGYERKGVNMINKYIVCEGDVDPKNSHIVVNNMPEVIKKIEYNRISGRNFRVYRTYSNIKPFSVDDLKNLFGIDDPDFYVKITKTIEDYVNDVEDFPQVELMCMVICTPERDFVVPEEKMASALDNKIINWVVFKHINWDWVIM